MAVQSHYNLNGKMVKFEELPEGLQQEIRICVDFHSQLDEAAKITKEEERMIEIDRICRTHPANQLQ